MTHVDRGTRVMKNVLELQVDKFPRARCPRSWGISAPDSAETDSHEGQPQANGLPDAASTT